MGRVGHYEDDIDRMLERTEGPARKGAPADSRAASPTDPNRPKEPDSVWAVVTARQPTNAVSVHSGRDEARAEMRRRNGRSKPMRFRPKRFRRQPSRDHFMVVPWPPAT